MEILKFRKGDIIFEEGDLEDWMYEIRKGMVGIYAGYGTPEEKELTALEEGSFLGELGLITGSERSASAAALENTELLKITDEEFAELEAKGKTGEFVAKSFGKIREYYRGNGSKTVMNCDSLAMMCVLFPDFIKSTINTHASCIVDVGETYAEVLFYKEGFTYDSADYDFDYNVVLVTEVDKAAFFDNYKSVL